MDDYRGDRGGGIIGEGMKEGGGGEMLLPAFSIYRFSRGWGFAHSI